MAKPLMTFANQLKFLREKLGWTQAQAAAHLEVSLSAVQKWEKGTKDPLLVTQEGVIARLQKAAE
jgi:DNA-binding transcriptional regulator YiaG